MTGRIELFKLYQKRSKSGRTYFVGWLGGAKLVVFKNDRAELREGTDGEWIAYAEPKDNGEAKSTRKLSPAPEREGTP
jgi:hypothetical protein